MIEGLTQCIEQYDAALQELLQNYVLRLEENLASQSLIVGNSWSDDVLNSILSIWSVSDFVAESTVKKPLLLQELIESGDLDRVYTDGIYREVLKDRLAEVKSDVELSHCLRLFRQREMCRVVWRDLTGLASMEETTRCMSLLAGACIDSALDWLYQDCCDKWGEPIGAYSGLPQKLIVLGMGKLGAYELNVSSDIDLIFAYPENGETSGGKRCLENQAFFIRLGQRLVSALDTHTSDGFVFRTDMRLRPYGQSGSLALSFSAMEEYYQDQGREWERYAMIKARVVAGDQQQGALLMESLRPFVYRRYLDYSAFQSLRDMKGMISREMRKKGMESNIKLGSGGIREIEFIVQAFQLIRGGTDIRMQTPELKTVLSVLVDTELLPESAGRELREAYVFLRNLEHAVQGMNDQQTQMLPEDTLARKRISIAMGYADWNELSEQLAFHRGNVERHFNDIIAEDDEGDDEGLDTCAGWSELWRGELSESESVALLEARGFESPEFSSELLSGLRSQRNVQVMQSQGRERLDIFMPLLLEAIAQHESRSLTLQRTLVLVDSVLRRTAYLVLLYENPAALKQLVWLCSVSPWISELLASTPLLLDELLNSESLYNPPDKAELRDELRQQLLRIPEDDLEEQMETLRHFKKAHVLRVAASELRGTLPLMKVSDYLTWIAEAELETVVDIAWKNLTEKHGFPIRKSGELCELDFAIIAYGKMGGLELGYTSDLDLVFIHDGDSNKATTGDRSIDTGVFFTRLGQRVIHILSTQTAGGQIYEVDMRLRPSGNSGLLVSSISAFEEYQKKEAWTWEHQALTRARFVAGSQTVGRAFEKIRNDIISQSREINALRLEVGEMREKMRASLGTKTLEGDTPKVFHVKHDHGGIVDIEFLCQFGVLGWSHQYPELALWTDNVRILESMAQCGLLDKQDALKLSDIYKAMRSVIHKRALQNLNSQVEPDAFAEERVFVSAFWKRFVGAD